jgi:hypothetical protein
VGSDVIETGLEKSRPAQLVLALLLLAHVSVHLWFHQPAYCGPDANGYFAQATRIAATGTASFRPKCPAQHLPPHWSERKDGLFVCQYSPGLPLLLLPLHILGGPEATLYFDPIIATLCVLLVFAVGRRLYGDTYALFAATCFAVLPAFNDQVPRAFAHLAVTAGVLSSAWLLLRWHAAPSRRRAFLLGLALGALPTIRYPAVLPALFIGSSLVVSVLRRRDRLRDLAWCASGALVPLVPLLVHNQLQYGAFWHTGYTLTLEDRGFSLHDLAKHAPQYLQLLFFELWAVFVLGAFGMIAMLRRRATRGVAIVMLGAVLVPTVLYASYYWDRIVARFLVATLPAYALATGWTLSTLRPTWPRRLAVVAVVLIQLTLGVPETWKRLTHRSQHRARTATIVAHTKENIPAGSVVISPRSVQTVLEHWGKWKLADEGLFPFAPTRALPSVVPRPVRDDGSRQASPIQPGKGARFRAKYDGVSEAERASLILDDLESWSGPTGRVFWIGDPDIVQRVGAMLTPTGRFLRRRNIALPKVDEAGVRPLGPDGPRLFWVPKEPLVVFEWVRS